MKKQEKFSLLGTKYKLWQEILIVLFFIWIAFSVFSMIWNAEGDHHAGPDAVSPAELE
jgi:hypothetical protein